MPDTTTWRKELGERISQARHDQGMDNRFELSMAIRNAYGYGPTPETVGAIERGTKKNVDAHVLQQIARVLDVDLNDLLPDAGEDDGDPPAATNR